MAHNIFLQAHFINHKGWPTFLTGTFPYFPSPCSVTSMYWGLKAPNSPSTAFISSRKVCVMPWSREPLPQCPSRAPGQCPWIITLGWFSFSLPQLSSALALSHQRGIIFPPSPGIRLPAWVIRVIQGAWAALRHILSAQGQPGTPFSVHFSMFSPQTGSVIAPNHRTRLCCSRKFFIFHAHIPAHSCKGCPAPHVLAQSGKIWNICKIWNMLVKSVICL